jgi:hypothetical protein
MVYWSLTSLSWWPTRYRVSYSWVHRKAEAVLSVIVPLRVNPPVFMVRVRPVNSLADSAKLSVSCSLVPIFGSDSTAKDAACKNFLPIDIGVQLTVREIELSKDGSTLKPPFTTSS